jgi:hypothetical protein
LNSCCCAYEDYLFERLLEAAEAFELASTAEAESSLRDACRAALRDLEQYLQGPETEQDLP